MSNTLYYQGAEISVSGSGSSPLSGLKICAIGDSLTQYMGSDLNDRIVALTGCQSVTNYGTAGAKWGNSNSDNTVTDGSGVGRTNQLINPYISAGVADEFDIITFAFGTNSDTSIGTLGDSDVSTTYGAMAYCFDKMLYYYRNAKIGVILPPQRARGIMTDTIEAIRTMCEYCSVPYYDMSGQGNIPCDNRMAISFAENDIPLIDASSSYGHAYFADNVHLSSIGKEQYYHKYARFLESLY